MTGLSLGRLQAASYNVYLKSVGGRLRAIRFLLSRLQAASYFCCLFYRAQRCMPHERSECFGYTLPQLNKNQSTSLNDSPNALIKLSISSSSVVNGKPN